MAPTVIFGDIRGLEIEDLKPILQKYGIKRLDTAAGYGDSERRLGNASMHEDFVIDTKILAAPLQSGGLSPSKVEESSRQSLERLRTDQVNVLYCHVPDLKTPLEDQARGFNDIYQKGRFKELGLSNFMPDMVESWLKISQEKGYVRPTWFQGQYNLIWRTYEDILFPILRKEGMHFAAFSPLAGGFLKGNLTPQGATGQRFVQHAAKSAYLGFYDRPECYAALEKLQEISKRTKLGPDELSLRWIMHHSQLDHDDIVILGASKLQQIEQSMQNLQKGPLEKEIADALNSLWTPELRANGVHMVDPANWKL